MMKAFGITIFIFGFTSILIADEPARVIELVDIQTANLYKKGNYGLNLRFYEKGNIVLRFALSITDRIILGVPLDIHHFIGREEIKLDLPPVVWAKIGITKEKGWIWPLAIGYDPLDYGYGRRGLFMVFTMPFYVKRLPLSWHIGLSWRIDQRVCGFSGLDLGINPNLVIYGEIDGIDKESANLNLGLRYFTAKNINIDINIRRIEEERPDRFIRLEYSARLF